MENAERVALEAQWKNKVDLGMNALAKAIEVWRRDKGFCTNWENVPEKLMLVVTELSEAMEAYRQLPRDGSMTLEHMGVHNNFVEELADAHIRLLDLSASLSLDIEHAIAHKMAVNSTRPFRHGKEC